MRTRIQTGHRISHLVFQAVACDAPSVIAQTHRVHSFIHNRGMHRFVDKVTSMLVTNGVTSPVSLAVYVTVVRELGVNS